MSGTAFIKPVTINAPGKAVVFDGCDFTKEALVVITDAEEVTFKNCRFYDLIPSSAKTYGIKMPAAAEVKLVIEGCFFGDNPSNEVGKMYNLIELAGKLKDGSSISKNYFTAGCCTHNQINVYDASEDAVIALNHNEAEYSANLVRLGLKGSPKCTINMIGNIYDQTEAGEYAGLLLIQPYGAQTVSMNDLVVNLSGTLNRSGIEQELYLYSNPSDTQYHIETNYPKVYVNGELTTDIYAAGGTKIGGLEESEA